MVHFQFKHFSDNLFLVPAALAIAIVLTALLPKRKALHFFVFGFVASVIVAYITMLTIEWWEMRTLRVEDLFTRGPTFFAQSLTGTLAASVLIVGLSCRLASRSRGHAWIRWGALLGALHLWVRTSHNFLATGDFLVPSPEIFFVFGMTLLTLLWSKVI